MWKKVIATADEKVENMARPQREESISVLFMVLIKLQVKLLLLIHGDHVLPKDGYLQKRRSIFQVVVVGLLNINNIF